MFKGFSFVHDDFASPERNGVEKQAYWNNANSDAYSASECSEYRSAFGEDNGGELDAC